MRAAMLAGYIDATILTNINNTTGSKTIPTETLAFQIGSITTPPKDIFPAPLTSNPNF